MAKAIIPLRPKGEYRQLLDNEMDCLTWLVLSGRPRLECFIEFIRPDLEKSPQAKAYAEQFFAVADTRNYLKDYEETIKEFLTPKKKERVEGSNREKRAEAALESFKDNVIDALEEDATDVDILKDKAQLAKTVGLLKEEEMTQAPPQRYLPASCNTNCRYKKFIDEQVALGNIIETDED